MARLVLDYGGVGPVPHELVNDIVMIGRGPSNHIVIDHPTVSAQHALLLRLAASYWLKDLDSTNGIQINGANVTETELNNGDRIRFGSVTAVYATTRPKSDLIAGTMQDAMEESYVRKAIGELLLAHLDKELKRCRGATHRAAIDFWASHIRDLKDR
jgi:predicted component of type VI protein secretion system